EPAEWGGICLPHLRTVARHPGAQGRVSRWSRHQAKAVERLVEDMQRYVLKRDALRRSLTTKEETDAAARALAFFAAHRVVVVRDESCDDGAQAPWQRITTAGAEKVDVVS
ncbi:MAG TPA: hypothetical protein VHB68_14445, partial [Steroidobacteraceae bacterium]|nr:hypothetical protein [Steroidobacteraceae bacterium]